MEKQQLKLKPLNKGNIITIIFFLFSLQCSAQIDSCKIGINDTVLIFSNNKMYKHNVHILGAICKSITSDKDNFYFSYTTVSDGLQPHYHLLRFSLKESKILKDYEYTYYHPIRSNVIASLKQMNYIMEGVVDYFDTSQEINLKKIKNAEEFKKILIFYIEYVNKMEKLFAPDPSEK